MQYKYGVITIKHKSDSYQFETLDQAMSWEKELDEHVKIEFNGSEVLGCLE